VGGVSDLVTTLSSGNGNRKTSGNANGTLGTGPAGVNALYIVGAHSESLQAYREFWLFSRRTQAF
jgi:hypothetical protein